EPRLRPPVALDAEHLEADDDVVALRVPVAHRELAVDAAADVPAFGTHADVFGDVEAAVDLHVDGDVVGEDAFRRDGARRQQQRGRQQPGQQRHAVEVHSGKSTAGAAR